MLHGNVGTRVTGNRIKRVTFYIPCTSTSKNICKEGAKVNVLVYNDMFVIILNM